MFLPGLKHVRLSKGVTQEELSERSGVHRDTIQKIETSQRPARPGTLRKLAEALGIETEELTELKEGRHRMSEEIMIEVPGHYPNFKDANFVSRFDGSEEAWLWNSLMDFKDRAMVESAARIVTYRGDDVDLSGVLSLLWDLMEEEPGEHSEAEKFIEKNRKAIEQRVKEIAELED